jgi:membrane protein
LKEHSFVQKIPGLNKVIHRLPRPIARAAHGLEILYGDIERCDLFKQASAMAYTTLLSIIPSLAAFFSVLTIFTPVLGKDSHLLAKAQDFIVSNLAQGTGDQVSNVLNNFIEKLDITKIGITSFAGLLITLIMLLKQIEGALNRVWLVRKERSMLMRSMYFWTFLTLGGFVLALAAGILSGFSLDSFNPFAGAGTRQAANPIFKILVSYSATLVFFFLVYKIVPNCKVSAKEAIVGAVIAAIMFEGAASGFGYYVKNFSKHQAIYGALAALPIFLSWIYICWMIILFGSVISWRVQQGIPERIVEDSNSPKLSTPEVRMREMRMQTIAPFLVLLAIHRTFKDGRGKGISGAELHRELCMPSQWVSDAIETLESMHYVVAANGIAVAEASDLMTARYFPSRPTDQVTIEMIRKDLLEAASQSIEKWNQAMPPQYLTILKSVTSSARSGTAESNIGTLLTGFHADNDANG